MRFSTSFGLCFLVAASLSSLACSSSGAGAEGPSTIREVSGALKPGENITQVVAVQSRPDAQSAKSFTADVDATGHFKLALPVGDRYIVLFMTGDKATGVLRFKDSQGAFTSILPVTHAPGASAGLKPQAKSEDEADDDDDDDDIELGDVDNPAGDDQYEPSQNPEDQVDSDGDGSSDSADQDDDNDGQEDSVDQDDDNDGSLDKDEDFDGDDDGSPDQVDSDDDNDGSPDQVDMEDDNDGTPDEGGGSGGDDAP